VVVCDQEIRGKDTIEVGKSMKLKLKNGAPDKTEWKSSSASVATVDESGKVTAVKAGKVVIAATNNGKTVTKTITVGAGK
jgi:alpha-amylase